MRGFMTEIIDFESYKKAKEEKEIKGIVNLWNKFPLEISDKYKPGDILVKKEYFDEKNGVLASFSFPSKEEIIMYNNLYPNDKDILWADMKKVALILEESDNLIG